MDDETPGWWLEDTFEAKRRRIQELQNMINQEVLGNCTGIVHGKPVYSAPLWREVKENEDGSFSPIIGLTQFDEQFLADLKVKWEE